MTAAVRGAQLTALDPVRTVLARSLRTGRVEQWAAASADGTWAYVREEDGATTWRIVHVGTGRWLLCGSLDEARRLTASGAALADVQRQEAEAGRPRCAWRGQWVAASCGEAAAPGRDRCPAHAVDA